MSAFEELSIDEYGIFVRDERAALLYQFFGKLKLSSIVFIDRKVFGIL